MKKPSIKNKNLAKFILITLGWSTSSSSIILQALYQRPTPTATDIILLAAISLLAGALLADARKVMFGYILSTALTIIIVFLILALPMLLGLVKQTGLYQIFYAGNMTMMFRYMFPTTFITSLISSIIGGYLGEEYLP